jgi:hypothetical protein
MPLLSPLSERHLPYTETPFRLSLQSYNNCVLQRQSCWKFPAGFAWPLSVYVHMYVYIYKTGLGFCLTVDIDVDCVSSVRKLTCRSYKTLAHFRLYVLYLYKTS